MHFWSTIISVIVGGIIAIGGGFIQRFYERRHEKRSLRAALRAEIQTILDIVGRRDYIEGLSKFIDAIERGSTNLLQIRVGRDYDTVFKTNCGNLGLLPSETAGKTVRFYYLVSSIAQDLDLLRDAADKPLLQAQYGLNTQDGNLAFHKQMQQLSIETIELGKKLVSELATA
jgi:hypothetical protein